MMVSLIQSNYMGFGSGIVVPGPASACKTAGPDFHRSRSIRIGRARQASHPYDHPRVCLARGAPYEAFGVMGGPMQPQAHLQTLYG